MNFAADVFVQRLGLDPAQPEHVIFCPFHSDSGTKSLSVNLERGVFYCHGGCDEPRGGGPIEFVIKWARHKEGKTLTRDDARRQLRRTFSVPNAKTLSRQMMHDELLLFAHECSNTYADIAKAVERVIARLGHPRDDAAWDVFAALHRELTWYDYAFETCRLSLRRVHPHLIAIYREAKARGGWSDEAAHDALVRADLRRQQRVKLRRWNQLRETTSVCHPESPSQINSQNPSPSRSRKTPVPRPKKRQPVPRRQPVTKRQPIRRPGA